MISATDRQDAIMLIEESVADGASLSAACAVLSITDRTFFRWKAKRKQTESIADSRPTAKRPTPSNKLSDEEEQHILSVLNSPEFADASPKQVVPKLADRGQYIASESTMYRLLHKNDLCHHRRSGKVPMHREAPTHMADAPNQVWMWDITYIPGSIKGSFFYLYCISDLFSRYITGWEIWEEQSEIHSSELVQRAYLKGHIKPGDTLVFHSDNGSPMKGSTMLATLQQLGVTPSFSRPRVSNDNAFAESLFNTLKSRVGYKNTGFESLAASREWTTKFVNWYNNEHYHSGISYLTPAQRHFGEWRDIVNNRTAVYEAAKAKHPERWNGREVRDWTAPEVVFLNPVNQAQIRPSSGQERQSTSLPECV